MALLLSLMSSTELRASHAAGAEMTYQCLGNNQYLVTMKFFWDCSGFAQAPASMSLSINNGTCSPLTSFTETIPQVGTTSDGLNSGTEISGYCADLVNQSTCGSGNNIGIQVFYYEGIVTLPSGCNDWTLSTSIQVRNPTDLTVGTDPLYTEAHINNLNGLCNDSPVFTSNPIPYMCAGTVYNYNPGAYDVNGDSLVYSLAAPRENATALVDYVAPHSPTYPITTIPANTFNFSSTTGTISCTAAPVTHASNIATSSVRVVVDQYDQATGTWLGSVERDMQIIVVNGPCSAAPTNTAPTPISGGGTIICDTLANGSVDTSNCTFILCPGETMVFTTTVTDPDVTDTLIVDASNTNVTTVFPGGAATVGQVYPVPGLFSQLTVFASITAGNSNIGLNNFTIGVTDQGCPIPGVSIISGRFLIPGVEVTASDTTICPGIENTISMQASTFSTNGGGTVNGTFLWSQISGPNAIISDPAALNPTLTVPSTTVDGDVIEIEVAYTTAISSLGTPCIGRDTLTINLMSMPISVNLAVDDPTLCPNGLPNATNFYATISAPGVDTINGNYTWSASNPARLADLTTANNTAVGAHTGTTYGETVTYTLAYVYGTCAGLGTVDVSFDAADITSIGNATICPGDSTLLDAGYTTSLTAIPALCDTSTTITNVTPIVISGSTTATTSTTTVSPFYGFWHDRRVQYLYTVAELNSMGVTGGIIESLAFRTTATISSSQPYNNFTIKMQCTSQVDMTSTFVPGSVQVFTTASYTPTAASWNTFNFDTPFVWNGVDNLLIEVCFDNTSYTSSDNIRAYTAPYTATTQDYTDNGAGCTLSTPFTSNLLPIIQLGTREIIAPISYQWTPVIGVGNDTIAVTNAAPNVTTEYIVTADDGECALSDTLTVTLEVTLDAPTVTCRDITNNAITFEWNDVTGATGYEYSTDGGATWIVLTAGALREHTVTGLIAGQSQELRVRALGGVSACPNNAAGITTCQTIFCEPTVTNTVSDVLCTGGSTGTITLNATGGIGGAPYSFDLFDASATLVNNNVSGVFSNLPQGDYYTIILDAVNCVDTVFFTVNEPTVLAVNLDATTMTSCYNSTDGTASVIAAGGTPLYSFAWNDGQVSAVATNLATGTYTVTLTDNNGCVDSLTTTVTSEFNQAPVVQATGVDATDCVNPDGSLSIQTFSHISGNTNTIQFIWTETITGNQVTGANVNNLVSGTYTLSVLDANGVFCGAADTVVLDGPYTSGTISAVTPNCGVSNAELHLDTVTAGMAPFTYSWTDINGNVVGTTPDVFGINGGVYTLELTDAMGCIFTSSIGVTDSITPVLNLNATSVMQLACAGDTDGVLNLDITPTNIQGLATVLWNTGDTATSLTNLAAGIYSVEVSYNGCISVLSNVEVREPSNALTAVLNVVLDNTCEENEQGELEVVATGGYGDYGYIWSNDAGVETTNSTLANLAGGNYTVTVIDRSLLGTECEVEATAALTVEFPCTGFAGMPNIFTPNGDGNNDRFKPVELEGAEITTFKIYNRWGQLVYDNAALTDGGWNGEFNNQPQPRDSYIYVLEYKYFSSSEVEILRGDVTLLR